MPRRKLILGNWKLNPKTVEESKNLITEIVNSRAFFSTVDVGIIPPQLFIPLVLNKTESTNISVGSQNCHYESAGAFTGETSAESLADIGVKYVLCGHSERRSLFNETNETINKKMKKALECGLTPVLCIGESLIERNLGLVEEICGLQLKTGLMDINNVYIKNVIIAYEPIWAIGTGKVCKPDDAEKTIWSIRRIITTIYGPDVGINIRILYGGSVNAGNVKDIISKEIDGCLVGGASIDAEGFIKLLQNA